MQTRAHSEKGNTNIQRDTYCTVNLRTSFIRQLRVQTGESASHDTVLGGLQAAARFCGVVLHKCLGHRFTPFVLTEKIFLTLKVNPDSLLGEG